MKRSTLAGVATIVAALTNSAVAQDNASKATLETKNPKVDPAADQKPEEENPIVSFLIRIGAISEAEHSIAGGSECTGGL